MKTFMEPEIVVFNVVTEDVTTGGSTGNDYGHGIQPLDLD